MRHSVYLFYWYKSTNTDANFAQITVPGAGEMN
jgi:hypothetical protein